MLWPLMAGRPEEDVADRKQPPPPKKNPLLIQSIDQAMDPG